MKVKMKELRIGELFCGPGGIAYGAEVASEELSINDQITFRHAWAVDYHQSSVQTYVKNISGATTNTTICADVRNFELSKLQNISEIEGFAYGFPCNDFSLVGEKKGLNGEFGSLYKYGVDVLKLFNPLFFIAENVGGLRGSHEGKALKKIVEDLTTAGYEVSVHLYKFEEYGIPQSRHRVILVGFRKNLGIKFKPPAPTHKNNHVTCHEAISTPPIPNDALNNELTKQHPHIVERLKHIKQGENAWTATIPENLRLNVKGAKLSQIYKRLDQNKPSYTVTGSGGGGTHVYHWSENRALTNRERARLQTFPDQYQFYGSKEDVRCQIGMAVPPMAAKMLFKAISNTLSGIDYHFVEENILL